MKKHPLQKNTLILKGLLQNNLFFLLLLINLLTIISCKPTQLIKEGQNKTNTPKKKNNIQANINFNSSGIKNSLPIPKSRIISEMKMRQKIIEKTLNNLKKDATTTQLPTRETIDKVILKDMVFIPLDISDYIASPAQYYENDTLIWNKPLWQRPDPIIFIHKEFLKPMIHYKLRVYISTEKCWYKILYKLDEVQQVQYQIIDCST